MVNFGLKDYNLKDTICAIATFPSKSALGVIKISGERAIRVIAKIFIPKKKKDIKKVKTYTLHYGWIIEKSKMKNQKTRTTNCERRTTSIIDEVLASVMRAPNSYTKEDVVEISSHGGILVLNKILKVILEEGARLALPGEFTYRALVRGRIDLLQAESIRDIVEARSEKGLRLAVRQLTGEGSEKIKKLKELITEAFVDTEAVINFPEDDVRVSGLRRKLNNLEKKINNLLRVSNEARILREGFKCVICGKTNVGKSTLFNRLLNQERVIVSNFPGTTRDVIEETVNIKGVPLRIYDTAGILKPKDLLAKKVAEKTSSAFAEADLVILVLDCSRRLNRDDYFLLEKLKNKNTILVINKIDLPRALKLKDISEFKGYKVKLSALKNIGMKSLKEAVLNIAYRKGANQQDMLFLNQYQRQSLKNTRDDIVEARNFLDRGYSMDFVNLSLRSSLDNLSKLTGERFSEEILESIFSNFCIGK